MLRSVALRPWPPIAAAENIASSLAIAGTELMGQGDSTQPMLPQDSPQVGTGNDRQHQ